MMSTQKIRKMHERERSFSRSATHTRKNGRMWWRISQGGTPDHLRVSFSRRIFAMVLMGDCGIALENKRMEINLVKCSSRPLNIYGTGLLLVGQQLIKFSAVPFVDIRMLWNRCGGGQTSF